MEQDTNTPSQTQQTEGSPAELPIVAPQTPITSAKKISLPIILAIVVVIILVGVGGVLLDKYVFTPQSSSSLEITPTPAQLSTTPTPVSPIMIGQDWIKYVSTTQRFEYYYPANWYIDLNPDQGENEFISFFDKNEKSDHSFGDHSGNEKMILSTTLSTMTFEELKSIYQGSKQFVVAGAPAFKKEKIIYIFLGPEDNHVISLTIFDTNKTDKILSTFMFIEPVVNITPYAAPQSWKVYENNQPQLSYSIKYPPQYKVVDEILFVNIELIEQKPESSGEYLSVAMSWHGKKDLADFLGNKPDKQPIQLNDLRGYQVTENSNLIEYYFSINSGTYAVLSKNITPQTDLSTSEIFDQILSTFKFLDTTNANQQICKTNGGNWLPEYSECENVSSQVCTDAKGVFASCTSACRHDPQAENCITLCVPVCSFE